MKNSNCDKLIFAVLQGEDYHEAIAALNEQGFYATVLRSSGGFLKQKSVTLMIGVNHAYVQEVTQILNRYGERVEKFYPPADLGIDAPSITAASIPIPVRCGGVVLFVLDVKQYQKY